MVNKIYIFSTCLMCLSTVFAQTETPSASPTAKPTVALCQDVQSCVDSGLDSLVASCQAAATTACTRSAASFALTAGQVAERALSDAKCSLAKTKQACNACYTRAKAPLQARYGFKLFQGLMGNAVLVVENERRTTCTVLPNRGDASEGSSDTQGRSGRNRSGEDRPEDRPRLNSDSDSSDDSSSDDSRRAGDRRRGADSTEN